MSTVDRYKLEDEAHSLAAQCRCYSYNGPCRFCRKHEKILRQLDRLDAEDEVMRGLLAWIRPKVDQETFDAIARGDWKKKPETPAV